ncbi:uncharacterized protein LOC142347934 [Convolutriloba macropyga]|uniref:uncharacterized protein LOC142347934 n=1 Tax=Convolutriloba macropyga TaxID=536237 RepID=UPI003F527A2D
MHQFAVSDLIVHTGDFTIKRGRKDQILVERKIPHPAYVRIFPTYNPYNDIGLLLLAQPVGTKARSIPLCNRYPPYAKLLGMCGMGPIDKTQNVHCFDAVYFDAKFDVSDLIVHTGDFTIKRGRKDQILVERKIPHPAYVRIFPTYNPYNDIGLLLLAQPVGTKARSIPLCNRYPPYAKLLGMCGMGPIDKTQNVHPNVLQEAFFFEKWGQWWDLSVNCRWELVCVESAVYDSHPTSGDSGSPLYLMGYDSCNPKQQNKAQCLFGVMAYREMNLYKEDEFEYMFSNVPFFYNWIVSTINNFNPKKSSNGTDSNPVPNPQSPSGLIQKFSRGQVLAERCQDLGSGAKT